MLPVPAEILEKISKFYVSEKHGFLIEKPVIKLPEAFAQWEDIARRLVPLLAENKFRETIDNELPIIDHTSLTTREELWAAANVLTHLGAAYVNDQNYGTPSQFLPEQIAIPWHAVADKLQTVPALTDYIAANCNYTWHDAEGKRELENIKILYTFTENRGYEWFMAIPVAMELEFGPVITSLLTIRHYLQKDEWVNFTDEIHKRFDTVMHGIRQMGKHLMRMGENLDPLQFYHGMRPYLAGSYNNPGLPNGLVFRGVSKEGKTYAGGSAAQTAMTPSMDALIPVKHHQAVIDYNMKLRNYIPHEHKLFLEHLDEEPNLTDLLQKRGDETLIEKFNEFIEEYVEFRNKHMQIVTSFIVVPASTKKSDFIKAGMAKKTWHESVTNDVEVEEVEKEEVRRMRRRKLSRSHSLSEVGTGGTPFMIYLKAIRDSTAAAKIETNEDDEGRRKSAEDIAKDVANTQILQSIANTKTAGLETAAEDAKSLAG